MTDRQRYRMTAQLFLTGVALAIGGGFAYDFGLTRGGTITSVVGGFLIAMAIMGVSDDEQRDADEKPPTA